MFIKYTFLKLLNFKFLQKYLNFLSIFKCLYPVWKIPTARMLNINEPKFSLDFLSMEYSPMNLNTDWKVPLYSNFQLLILQFEIHLVWVWVIPALSGNFHQNLYPKNPLNQKYWKLSTYINFQCLNIFQYGVFHRIVD